MFMGNPLSQILCDIYTYYAEEKFFDLLNFKCWMRYVNYTFVSVHNPFDISNILETVNSIDPYSQLIFVLESCNKFPILDCLNYQIPSFLKTCVSS